LTLRDLDEIDVDRLRGVGDKKKAALEHFGIQSVLDLLETYPRRWVDRTHQASLSDLELGVDTLVVVRVVSVATRAIRGGKVMVNVVTTDDTGRLSLTFFNQRWRQKQLQEGMTIAVFGKPESYRGYLQMTNPIVDLLGDRTGRIVPIYPQSEKSGIHSWHLAAWVENALERCAARGIAEPLPQDIIDDLHLLSRGDALRAIHLPDSDDDRRRARQRLAFDEVLRVQLMLVGRKKMFELQSSGCVHRTDGPLLDRFLTSLPFPLTGAQKRAIAEINADVSSVRPMHRLLQGDVGAGKTLVAVWMMLCAVQSGHQAALMAPTEVLADQHAIGVRRMLESVIIADDAHLFGERPVRVELLTNKVTGEQRRNVLAGLADGTVDIVIGTHALIQESVEFHSLGAVVVDEQHRFGVEQRAALRDKALASATGTMPDVLVMTATPIPRTAAMTVYGDLDVSVLDELPPGRTPIKTEWINGDLEVQRMWAEIREAISSGDQVYVVCPLIDESEKLEVASAQETFDDLSSHVFPDSQVGLLHGRMASIDKENMMNKFREGQIDVLVATTVIEVGVDVPNATVMVVLDADRFGIAQLHQLRGRVGRGAKASRCYLVTHGDEMSPRVDALVQSTDGFELAEIDLALRGEGTIMSSAQKGRSDLRLASLQTDLDLIQKARDAAVAIIDNDPTLSSHQLLRDELDLLFSQEDEEFLFKS
jgi:ATP-dependent DNA helicase RecG